MIALVATDIVSRGLDRSDQQELVNDDLPRVPEDEVRRIGWTGRASAGGTTLSLVCPGESDELRTIERTLGRRFPVQMIQGFEPDPTMCDEPVRQGRPLLGERPNRDHRGARERTPQ